MQQQQQKVIRALQDKPQARGTPWYGRNGYTYNYKALLTHRIH